jgi:dihydroorotase
MIKGGRVIDPSVRLDAIRDVAISAGRIAAVETNIAAQAAETIDARGKLVVPGLIDIHTHTARSADGPGLVLQDVTGWIDAGSQRATISRQWPSRGQHRSRPKVLINIGRAGILPKATRWT